MLLSSSTSPKPILKDPLLLLLLCIGVWLCVEFCVSRGVHADKLTDHCLTCELPYNVTTVCTRALNVDIASYLYNFKSNHSYHTHHVG